MQSPLCLLDEARHGDGAANNNQQAPPSPERAVDKTLVSEVNQRNFYRQWSELMGDSPQKPEGRLK